MILSFYLGLNLQKNNKSRKSKKGTKELITSTKVVAYLKLMGLQIVVNLKYKINFKFTFLI